MLLYDSRFICKCVWLLEVVYITKELFFMVNQRYLGLNTLLISQLLINDFKSLQLNLFTLRRGLFVDWNWEYKGGSMETGPQWVLVIHLTLETDANIELPNPPLILPLCLPQICFWLCPYSFIFYFKTYLFSIRHWIHSCRSCSEQSRNDLLSFITFGLVCHSTVNNFFILWSLC